MDDERVDVVVVGASIAGCTAAVMFGRAGLRVALLERRRDPNGYKAMCGHFILGGAKDTLDRLGFWDAMVDAGAAVTWPSILGGGGWIHPVVDDVPPAISLRRSTLDPLLRRIAADTPGVALAMGAEVIGVVEDQAGRVTGVRVAGGDEERTIGAPLVVGADGHRSAIARLAGVPESTAPNGRCFWWAYYRNVDVAATGGSMVWRADPDGFVITPADDGVHLVAAFPSKAHRAAFAGDRVAALEGAIAKLPDGPDLSGAERVSNVIGTSDHPFVSRDPLPRPGLALIGDAAMTSDPLPASGCGWAFRSAAWLADAAIPGLRGEEPLDDGLSRYRASRGIADAYEALVRVDAVQLESAPERRALMAAAAHDRELARRVGLFGMRAAPPDVLINPDTMARVLATAPAPSIAQP